MIVFAAGFMHANLAKADGVDLHQVLHGPTRCDHVIELMMRHGINNDNRNHGYGGGSMMHHSPMGPMWIPHDELGDLELIEVAQLPVVDPACGPKFAVVIENKSKRDVCGFRVTLVGLLGRIFPTAPTTVVKVDKICAGQAAEVHVQLPIEALAMGTRNGQAIEFARLVVAIDSFDQFAECNEANNVKVFDRTSIAIREVAVQSTAAIEQVSGQTGTATVQAGTASQGGATTVQGISAPSGAASGPAIQGGAGQGVAQDAPAAPQVQAGPSTPQSAPPASDDLMSAINKLDMKL
tara:strand:+ start:2753 stop:3634 length:882 start_codon:yes stop_codon:yes gene_type:complete